MSDDFETELRTGIAAMAEQSKARKEAAETEVTKNKPDWKHWLNLASVRLDDAIVLSCDIDPAWHGNRTDILQVCKRKSIADSHIASGTLKVTIPSRNINAGNLGDHLVALCDFRSWGESLRIPFTFPQEFPAASATDISTQLNPKAKVTALKLVFGMALAKYGYDPAAKRSAIPKQIAIDLTSKGIAIDEDTVRNWLNEASDTIEIKPKSEKSENS